MIVAELLQHGTIEEFNILVGELREGVAAVSGAPRACASRRTAEPAAKAALLLRKTRRVVFCISEISLVLYPRKPA